MSCWTPSSRTMKGMWFSPVTPSWRTRCAMYTPETAAAGTAQDAETLQFPASTSPMVALTMGGGWTDAVCCSVATLRAPRPP